MQMSNVKQSPRFTMKKTVANRVRTYLKEEYLGKGGFAYCMRVLDLDDINTQRYAMKIMPKIMNGKERSREKFRSEIQILSKMDHPNIAKLIR